MRARNTVLSLTALICSATIHGQQQPVQTFRSGRELLTIDTSVRAAGGKPVTDLQASDFTVRIDGQPRPVLTVQVFGVNETRVSSQSEPPPRFARAPEKPGGRVVVFAIDRDSMRPGSERAALQTISRVIEALSPADAAGVVEIPGRSVELTRDHTVVANAVKTMTGTAPPPAWQHYMSWDEAVAYELRDKGHDCAGRQPRVSERENHRDGFLP
jgi:hypothetical protein